MDEYMQFSAKTKNEAITKACMELGTSSDQLDITVVSEGTSGFFGIGSKPAIIKVRRKAAATEDEEFKDILKNVSIDSIHADEKKKEKNAQKTAPKDNKDRQSKEKSVKDNKEQSAKEKPVKEKQPQPKQNPETTKVKEEKKKVEKPEAVEKPVSFEKITVTENTEIKEEKEVKENKEKHSKEKQSKPVEIITDEAEIADVENRAVVFLRDVFTSMDLKDVEIKSVYNREDGSLEVDFEGDDMGVLIGKRGQTLDSLQYLTSLVVNKGKENYIRVKLDTEDYRRRRKETLENLAKGIAYKVKKTRKPVILEPMNPYERRIIHSALQGNKYVETISEGEEPYRHIVVRLKK